MKYKPIKHLILAIVSLILIILITQTNNHFNSGKIMPKPLPVPQPQERIPLQAAKEPTTKLQERPSLQATEEKGPMAKPQEKSKPSCCSIASQHKLEELCPTNESVAVISDLGNGECNCTDYMMCKLVIVTALSSNHFIESLDFFGSVYAKLPRAKIILYDLGLTAEHLRTIQSYCNVQEIRKFKYDQYPKHAEDLFLYAWKPFIIKEISQEYELFFYCDSSCRVTDIFVPFLPNILKFPIISLCRVTLVKSVIRYTHQGTLDYFGINMTRAEMMKILPHNFQAGVLLVWVNDLFKNKILPPWVDCAEHVECIAPKGASRDGCNAGRKPISAYVGCHRYDQSALNVLLIREFGATLNTIFNDKDGIPLKKVVNVTHVITNDYDNSKSHECNIKYH